MAKPAGALAAVDGGWPLDDPTLIPIQLVIFSQPEHWADSDSGNSDVEAWRQITVDAGAASTERFYGLGGLSTEETEAGAVVASWLEYEDAGPLYPSGNLDLNLGFADSATEPNATSGQLLAECDTRSGAEIQALYFHFEADQAYGTPEPELSLYLEACARNTDANAWRPHDAQRPASAWLFQRAVSIALDRILYQTRQAWSVIL